MCSRELRFVEVFCCYMRFVLSKDPGNVNFRHEFIFMYVECDFLWCWWHWTEMMLMLMIILIWVDVDDDIEMRWCWCWCWWCYCDGCMLCMYMEVQWPCWISLDREGDCLEFLTIHGQCIDCTHVSYFIIAWKWYKLCQ